VLVSKPVHLVFVFHIASHSDSFVNNVTLIAVLHQLLKNSSFGVHAAFAILAKLE
jgi:hypothetical protein